MAKPVFSTGNVPTADQFNQWLVNVGYAYKSSTQNVTSSTTLQNDNDLVVPVVANAHYHLILNVAYGGNASGDLKLLIRTPTGGSFNGMGIALPSTAASQGDIQMLPYVGNSAEVWGVLGSGPQWGRVEGILITAGTAGNCQIEWAQNTSNATATTLQAGSFLSLRRLS